MTIDKATEADVGTLARLLGEVEAYYGKPGVVADPEQIRAALFGPHPVATVLLARDDGEVQGFASYSYLWPAAGADTSVFLKELFVRDAHRRKGVAARLMDAVREAGRIAGCGRLEWHADDDNPPALDFYEASGAEPHPGKVFYRQAL